MIMGNTLDLKTDRDKRAQVRDQQPLTVQILPCHPRRGSFGFIEAEQVDCSSAGIGLVVREQIPVGESFLVKVIIGKPQLIAYTVKHCSLTGREEKKFRIGGKLVGAVDSFVGASPEVILKALRGQT